MQWAGLREGNMVKMPFQKSQRVNEDGNKNLNITRGSQGSRPGDAMGWARRKG